MSRPPVNRARRHLFSASSRRARCFLGGLQYIVSQICVGLAAIFQLSQLILQLSELVSWPNMVHIGAHLVRPGVAAPLLGALCRGLRVQVVVRFAQQPHAMPEGTSASFHRASSSRIGRYLTLSRLQERHVLTVCRISFHGDACAETGVYLRGLGLRFRV